MRSVSANVVAVFCGGMEMQTNRKNTDCFGSLSEADKKAIKAIPASMFEPKNLPPVLDACCGTRMMWFNKKNPNALYIDKRRETFESNLPGRSPWVVDPDKLADFTDMPFPDASFYLVVFDPPHMTSLGVNAHMAKKYGRLFADWETDIRAGFAECFRVLKPMGTLVFKWNETDVPLSKVLELAEKEPLFGHTTGRKANTHWVCWMKF